MFLILLAIIVIVVATILIGLYQMSKKINQPPPPRQINPDDVQIYIENDTNICAILAENPGAEAVLLSYQTLQPTLTDAEAAQFSDSDGYMRWLFSTNLTDWTFLTNTAISQSSSWYSLLPTNSGCGFFLRQVVITNTP